MCKSGEYFGILPLVLEEYLIGGGKENCNKLNKTFTLIFYINILGIFTIDFNLKGQLITLTQWPQLEFPEKPLTRSLFYLPASQRVEPYPQAIF